MPTPDFRDRIHTAILEGGSRVLPWVKILTNTAAGQVNCLFQSAGMPEAGTYPGNALEANIITAGVVPNILGPDSLRVKAGYRHHLIQAEALAPIANLSGILMVGDLLATYRGLPANTAAAQDLSTVGSAAGRSILPRYCDGSGVRIFADVTTAFGATPVTLTVTYTNELGTSGQTSVSTTTASAPATRAAAIGLREPFSLPLASGDKGVRSLQTAQLSGTTGAAGVYSLLLYRPLVSYQVMVHGTGTAANYGVIKNNGSLQPPEILSGASLVLFWMPLTAVNDALWGTIKTSRVSKGR